MAATELGADWVINADADEFWWPRGGTLKDVFALVPARYGVVRGCWRHFLPRPDEGGFFAERMIVRLCVPAFPGDKRSDLPRAPEGRSPGRSRGRGRSRQPQRVRRRVWSRCAAGIPSRCCTSRCVRSHSSRGSARADGFAIPTRTGRRAPDSARRRAAHRPFPGRCSTTMPCATRSSSAGLADGTLAVDTRLRDALHALARRRRSVPAAATAGRPSPSRRRLLRTRQPSPRRPRCSLEIDGIVRVPSSALPHSRSASRRLRRLPRR